MERSLNDHALMETTDSRSVAKPHARRSMAWLQAVAFLLGALLLVYIIRRVGVQTIFAALARVGFGFFLVVAIMDCDKCCGRCHSSLSRLSATVPFFQLWASAGVSR